MPPGRVWAKCQVRASAETSSCRLAAARDLLEEPSGGAERCEVVSHLGGLGALELGGEPRRLVDGALGVELGGEVRSADLEGVDAELSERRLERRLGLLPGAHDHRVARQHLPAAGSAAR